MIAPPAATREPELIAHIKRHRENHPGLHRDGSLDDRRHYDPCDPFAARRILEDFTERCQAELQGVPFSESDWNNWTYPEPSEEEDDA